MDVFSGRFSDVFFSPLAPPSVAAAVGQMSEKMELSEKQAEEGLVDEAQALLAEVCLFPRRCQKGIVRVCFSSCFCSACFVPARGLGVPYLSLYLTIP